jgi:NAD(P)-dependent dehydrogenase (short-subunit alcohol dehydrogenase family)
MNDDMSTATTPTSAAGARNTDWTVADIPSQAGRLAVVTGTGGLGFETALALVGAGAEVILAGRNDAKGRESVQAIKAMHPGGKIAFGKLDLASLASVADFASRFTDTHSSLDLLVNNAGVMTPPTRQTTADGFELQFGTNYLGHFALTARLLSLLRRGRQPRVVSVSSAAHRLGGAIHFDNLQAEHGYRPWTFYAQSKLANLLFAFELQRQSDANGWGLMSNAAHPGYARTELIANGPGRDRLSSRMSVFLQPWISHSAAAGALPSLFAATSPEAKGAGYYGPSSFFELKGPPASAHVVRQARDFVVAKKLWEVSERLTGTTFGDHLSGVRRG